MRAIMQLDDKNDGETSLGDNKETEEQKIQEEKQKGKSWWRKFLSKGSRHLFKPLIFIIINGLYLLFGAVVFLELERKPETEKVDISTEILEILQTLNDTRPELLNRYSFSQFTSENLVSNMSGSDVELWQSVLGNILERRATSDTTHWTLSRSVFFCTTLLTTIGYGNIAPVTTPGRIFCVFYCCVGIPFNIMLLAVVGKLMADVINRFVAEFIRLWTCYLHPNYEWKSLKDKTEINAPVWLALIIFISFLCFCSFIYSLSEGWDYWTACYFTFITFTTIGLGDIVPKKTETLVFIDTTLLYIGLAVLALTVNLIVAHVIEQFKKTREKLPFVDRLELGLNSDSD